MDLLSPPFPPELANVKTMYRAMIDLFAWAVAMRQQSAEEIDCDCLPAVNAPPNESLHVAQPIIVHDYHLDNVRTIRCSWDEIVRRFEDDWEAVQAKRYRHWLVGHVVNFLNHAYESSEVREARLEKNKRRFMEQALGVPHEPGAVSFEEFDATHGEED